MAIRTRVMKTRVMKTMVMKTRVDVVRTMVNYRIMKIMDMIRR